ncbi:MAG: hypothetical protein RIF41_08255 [Polyangiaceae bacterium]
MTPILAALAANTALAVALTASLYRSENRRARRLRRGLALGAIALLEVRLQGEGTEPLSVGETLETHPLSTTDIVLESHEVLLEEVSEDQPPRRFRLRPGFPIEIVRLDDARRERSPTTTHDGLTIRRFTCDLPPGACFVVAARLTDDETPYRGRPVTDLEPVEAYAVAQSADELLEPRMGVASAVQVGFGLLLLLALAAATFQAGVGTGLAVHAALYPMLLLAIAKLVRDGNLVARHAQRLASMPREARRLLPQRDPPPPSESPPAA